MWHYLPINELWKTFTGKPFKSLFSKPRYNCHFDKARYQTEFLLKFRLRFAEAAFRTAEESMTWRISERNKEEHTQQGRDSAWDEIVCASQHKRHRRSLQT